MENDKNIPQHIIDMANRMVAKGSKSTFDQICERQMEAEAKKAKSSAKNWARREKTADIINDPNFTVRHSDDIYAEAAMNQRGSSMRD